MRWRGACAAPRRARSGAARSSSTGWGLRRCRGRLPARAVRRRAAALRARQGARQRPGGRVRRRADRQPRSRGGRRGARVLREGARRGRAVVLVTHEEAAADIADRVLRLRDGVLAGTALREACSPGGLAAAGRRRRATCWGRRSPWARAGHGVRPRGEGGRPPRRHRALRPRAPARSTRSCGRCRTSRRRRTARRSPACASGGTGRPRRGTSRSSGRAGAGTRSSRAATPAGRRCRRRARRGAGVAPLRATRCPSGASAPPACPGSR